MLFLTNDLTNKRISYKAKLIANSVERAVNKTTHGIGLTSAQAFILGYIYNNSDKKICQKDIENNFNIKHPTAAGILKRLEENGFIKCVPSSDDRRFKLIEQTQKALDLHEEIVSQIDAVESSALAGLDEDEKRELNRLLDKVIANVVPDNCSPVFSLEKGEDL